MLMTILKIPRLDSPAQPKYTPEVCSERTEEKFSAGKLAARKKGENVNCNTWKWNGTWITGYQTNFHVFVFACQNE